MEMECSVGDNHPNVCVIVNVQAELDKDNIEKPPKMLDSIAEKMLISEPINELSASNNPPETAVDVDNGKISETETGEHANTVDNIIESMIISATIAKSSINDNPPDVIGNMNNRGIVENVKSSTPIDSNTEIITVSEPIVLVTTSDCPPKITVDMGNSNIIATDDQANPVGNNIEATVISSLIDKLSAINEPAKVLGDGDDNKTTEIKCDEEGKTAGIDIDSMEFSASINGISAIRNPPDVFFDVSNNKEIKIHTEEKTNTSYNDIEPMVISAPIPKITDESAEVCKVEVQMTDALRGIAAAYSDSSDSEEEIRIVGEQITISDPVKNTSYRCRKSDDETDSEEDSSSDSSSSDSSPESANETDSESESENRNSDRPKKRRERKRSEKGEYDKLPPIEDLNISVPEVLCNPVGKVGWMVEQMVVVTQLKETKALNPTLNIDTVLFIERGRRVLGRIFDVFGTVSDPHYCVRFNDAQHIKENNIEVGMTVYYCPNTPHTTLVFMADLLKMKASDDVGDDEHPAFSDDEEERAYYSSLKQIPVNNNGKGNDKNTEVPKKRPCFSGNNSGWKSKHPWNNDRRTQQKPQQHQQHHRNPNNFNNMQQRNSWQYPPAQYNQWISNPAFYNWPRPFSMESRSHYSSSSFQSNVDFSRQPRPSFVWPNNGTTFTPTQTQSAPWHAPALPPSFPLQSPPPPPPGI